MILNDSISSCEIRRQVRKEFASNFYQLDKGSSRARIFGLSCKKGTRSFGDYSRNQEARRHQSRKWSVCVPILLAIVYNLQCCYCVYYLVLCRLCGQGWSGTPSPFPIASWTKKIQSVGLTRQKMHSAVRSPTFVDKIFAACKTINLLNQMNKLLLKICFVKHFCQFFQ